MITQLAPEQVAKHWDVVKYALERALPPIASQSPERMNKLLEAMLTGQMQCWVSYRKDDERTRVETVMVTTPVEDTSSGAVDLLIYALYGYTPAPREAWVEGLASLREWAAERGFARITAYTNSLQVVQLVRELGGEAEYAYVSFNVSGNGGGA